MHIKRGFLLTSHWRDTASGLELSFYGTDGNRPFKLVFTGERPVFFILSQASFNPTNFTFERKNNGLKSFAHQSVDTIYLQRYSDIELAREYCAQNALRTFEMDVFPTDRFLMERFISTEVEFAGEFTEKLGVLTYTNPQIRPTSESGIELGMLSLDIETGIKGELYSIGLHYQGRSQSKKMVVMGNQSTFKQDEQLWFYGSEKQLLQAGLEIINQWDPDIIVGWHVVGFDLKFLERKCQQHSLEFNLGRGGERLNLIERKGQGIFADLPGRVILDGPPVLRGAFYTFKDMKLETVANQVLGVGKDIASDEGKVAEIERRYREDKQALAKYNLLDCTLVLEIFEKLKIVDLLITRTRISGLLLDRLQASVQAFDHLYLPRLHRKGFVAPNKIDIQREEASSGGMVIEPKVGLHEYTAVFDFQSLYPSIIMTFKIDPLSHIQREINPVVTPAGYKFSRTENILPPLIEELVSRRLEAKAQKNANLSQAIKILMNSFYGVMGAPHCRFYQAELPQAITTTGQWILTQSMQFFENHGLEVVYGDTDSIFIKFGVNKSTEECQRLVGQLNSYLAKILWDQFQVESKLECKFEKMYQKIYFSSMRHGEGGARKRYAELLDGQIEFKGMEFVRSDWTELAKNFQMELYKKFFAGEDLEQFIIQTIQGVEQGNYDQDLVYTKRLTKAAHEYTKNIPVHVRAAMQLEQTGPYRAKSVSYVITTDGPVPVQKAKGNYDYQHYIEKQLKPVANDILLYLGKDFDSLRPGKQLSFF